MRRLLTALLLAVLAGACSQTERETCATAVYVEVTATNTIVVGDKTLGLDDIEKALRDESVKCDRKKLRVMLGGEGLADVEASQPIMKALSASKDIAMIGVTKD